MAALAASSHAWQPADTPRQTEVTFSSATPSCHPVGFMHMRPSWCTLTTQLEDTVRRYP